MKPLVLPFLMFLQFIVTPAVSQHWMPFDPAYKYNFGLDTDSMVTDVIKIDSSFVSEGDSIFCLHPVAKVCEECSYFRILVNQPGFLKRMMIKKEDGVYIFSDPGTFLIKTKAYIGSDWIFDSLAGITAQVTAITYEAVFDVMDSVREITLSDGRIIRISKDHGLLSFPVNDTSEYRLLGIAGPDLGIVLPRFSEIFNFDIGDIFQYSIESQVYIGDRWEYNKSIQKRKVMHKEELENGYSYNYLVLGKSLLTPFETWKIDTFSVTFLKANYPLAESEPRDFIPERHYLNYQMVSSDTGKNKILGKSFFEPATGDTFNIITDVMSWLIMSSRIGIVHDFFSHMVHTHDEFVDMKLVGYVVNGDTTGEVYPDWYFTDIDEPEDQINSAVFPVPTAGVLNIVLPEKIQGKVEYFICSIDGHLIRKGIFNENITKLDLTFLPDGLYIIKMSSGNWSGISRFVKRGKR